MEPIHTMVLADGGGAAALQALDWLRATTGAAVVTVTVDFGQEGDLEAVRDRALAAGAARAHVVDRRSEFAREFLLPALKADAELPAAAWAALAWPLLARTLVEIAAMEGATTVAHGCATASQGGLHLDAAVRALGPDLMVIAAGPDGTGEGGRPSAAPARPAIPDEAAAVAIAFARGVPTALNGIDMPLEDMLASLGTIAGAYAPARTGAESRGTTSLARGRAMAALGAAHRALRTIVTDARLDALCDLIGREYGALVADGAWFTPARRALDGFADEVQARVTGSVRLRLSARGIEGVTVSTPFARADAGRRPPAARRSDGLPIAL